MIFYKIDNILLADRHSIDADSFTEIYQVRGGVKTYFVTGRLEDGCQCVRARTLSVGSCYMDGLELPMRVSKVLIQFQGSVQSCFVGILAYVLEEGGAVI